MVLCEKTSLLIDNLHHVKMKKHFVALLQLLLNLQPGLMA